MLIYFCRKTCIFIFHFSYIFILALTADRKRQYLEFLDDLHERDLNSKLSAVRKEEKIEIVKKMIENNIDIEMIMKITGLSKEEIEKLATKNE